MRVYNLTDQRIDYKGRLIAPYGSEEYDITFIPDRDRNLEKAKILAFGFLPKGWKKPQPPPEPVAKVPVAVQQVAKPVEKVVEKSTIAVSDEVKTEDKAEFFKKSHNKR